MKVHMSLPSTNLEQTIEFYSVLFGEPPTKVRNDYVKFDPKSVPLNISFHLVDSHAVIDVSRHLGFELDNQAKLDDIYQHLEATGLVTRDKVESTCCYGKQDKFWLQDPVGFKWELYVLLQNTEDSCTTSGGSNERSCC